MRYIFLLLALTATLVLSSCSDKAALKNAEITKLSISSDGHYVISGYDNHYLILWNITNRSYHVISRHANNNSPYFIKHTHTFIWQNTKNEVYVQNIKGQVLQQFPLSYPVLSQVMASDLKTYISEDKNWKLYKGHGPSKQIMKMYGDGGSKPMNLTLSKNSHYLLTSGSGSPKIDKDSITKSEKNENTDHWDRLGGVVLWNVQSGKPIQKYWGNVSQTYATLSPNNQYVIAGDLQPHTYVFNALTGKRLFMLYYLTGGYTTCPGHTGDPAKDCKWVDVKVIPMPKGFVDTTGQAYTNVFAIKYITEHQYLRFFVGVPYAVLYQNSDRKPLKYLPLGKVPFSSDNDLSRDESIDTSPSAHILVTGQEVDDGINVYQYDPKTQTLYRVWTPIINKRSNMPPISKDVPTLPGVKFSDLTKVKQVG